MNKILKYLKKNIYLVCLAIVLAYISYDKLYKKEGLENSCESIFGKKEDRKVIKDIATTDGLSFDNTKTENTTKIWLDMNSIKVNGSKKLRIIDANEYNLLKEKNNKCRNRGLLSRILNKRC